MKSHGREYFQYICPNHRSGYCPTKGIKARPLHHFVTSAVLAEIFKNIDLNDLSCQFRNTECNNINRIENNKREVEKSIMALTEAIAKGSSDALLEKLHEQEAKKKRLEAELKEMNVRTKAITSKNMTEVRKKLRKYLKESSDPIVREFIRENVKEILVSNEEIMIELNIL